MAYPGLKFVYNGTDSEGVYVEIDDTKRNYFGPDYVEFDDSFEGHDGYKSVPNSDEGDVWDASYTYKDYFDRYGYSEALNPKELKKDFLEQFENHIIDTLFNASKSFHSYDVIGSDYDKISGFKNCIKSAKKDLDTNYLVESRNEGVLDDIRYELKRYYGDHDIINFPEELDYQLNRIIELVNDYRTFNKVKYKNFNIKVYIQNNRIENLNEIVDFIRNGKNYFN